MLSSIHPFGERSRDNSFWLTAVAHIAGSAVGGVALGALIGAAGWSVSFLWPADPAWRYGVLAAVAVVAAGVEASGRERRLPGPSRQVNENWIQTYRGWVYGGGFGIELGFGLATIVTTSLVHVLVAAMFLAGSFGSAVLMGLVFGMVRGATLLAAFTVDDPVRLRSLHRRLDALGTASRTGGLVALTAIGVVSLTAAAL